MDYETPDGSQFSLRAVWADRDGEPAFDYTTVSAYVEGVAYTGRLYLPPHEVDEGDVLKSLEAVPLECIRPKFQDGFTVAPEYNQPEHYVKAPTFTYDDAKPGKTFVAECVLNEVSVLEQLKINPHPNIVAYHGCYVKDGLISHLCLKRYPSSLFAYADAGLSADQNRYILNGIKSGIDHLHSLGLANNDINPQNICIDADGNPIIVDFDSCLPFGKKLMKGTAHTSSAEPPMSSKDNDLVLGIGAIEDYLWVEGEIELVEDLPRQKDTPMAPAEE